MIAAARSRIMETPMLPAARIISTTMPERLSALVHLTGGLGPGPSQTQH